MMKTSITSRTIDLSRVNGYIDGEYDRIILGSLDRAELLGPEYVYTVFNWMRARNVRRTGRTIAPSEKFFYAFAHDQLAWDNGDPNCLKVCAKMYLEPGLAVYDSSQVELAYEADSDFGYSFKFLDREAEALRGLFRLKTE